MCAILNHTGVVHLLLLSLSLLKDVSPNLLVMLNETRRSCITVRFSQTERRKKETEWGKRRSDLENQFLWLLMLPSLSEGEGERGRDLISDYVTRQTQHLILSSGFPDTHTLPVSSSRGALPGLEDKTNQTGLYRASPYTGPIVIQKKSKETQPYSSSTPGQKWPNSHPKNGPVTIQNLPKTKPE